MADTDVRDALRDHSRARTPGISWTPRSIRDVHGFERLADYAGSIGARPPYRSRHRATRSEDVSRAGVSGCLCPRGNSWLARRRELRGAGRGPAERAVGAGRGARAAPHRQPVDGIPQSRSRSQEDLTRRYEELIAHCSRARTPRAGTRVSALLERDGPRCGRNAGREAILRWSPTDGLWRWAVAGLGGAGGRRALGSLSASPIRSRFHPHVADRRMHSRHPLG